MDERVLYVPGGFAGSQLNGNPVAGATETHSDRGGALDALRIGLLDFNKACNPPCVFTPFATCPLPPPENRLKTAD